MVKRWIYGRYEREKGLVLGVAVVMAAMLMPVVSSAANEVYFRPSPIIISDGECHNITVQILLNATDQIDAWSVEIEFDPACINITDYSYGKIWTTNALWKRVSDGRIRMWNSKTGCEVLPNGTLLANLTIHCKGSSCESPLNFTGDVVWQYLGCSAVPTYYDAVWRNTTVRCGREKHLLINEFMSDPSAGNDWVELYNPTDREIDLAGWTLNDSTSRMKELSGSISAGGYKVVDVGRRLDKAGDEIILLKDGVVVDNVTYGKAPGNAPVPPTDKSAGRYPDGKDTDVDCDDFIIFDVPTPGAKNVREPSTPFLIFGRIRPAVADRQAAEVVSGARGVLNVTVTNLNTSETFIVETADNCYQVITSSEHVSAGDVLHFRVCDDGNCAEFNISISEKNMTDGYLFVNVTIGPLLPDLNVTAIETPPQIYANVSNIINATIENIGDADAGAFNVSLRVNGIVIGVMRIDALGAGLLTNVSFEWIPTSTGKYEICVAADADDEIEERDEMNNEMCTSVTVEEKPEPDLMAVLSVPAALIVNERAVINATIENIGDADAGAFNVSLRVNGSVLNKTRVESLSAGASVDVSFEWTPRSAGDHEICAVADCDGEIDERDETNNISCEIVTVGEKKPDMTVAAIEVPPTYANISSIINATIENIGDADAGAFNVSLLVDYVEIEKKHVEALKAGNTTDIRFNWTPSAGEHVICVVADCDGEIDERDETNNELCKNVTVRAAPKPDITVAAIEFAHVYANVSNIINATIENIGDADAGAFNISLVADGVNVDVVRLSSLRAGAVEDVSFVWNPQAVDVYVLCVIADPDDEVEERDETNNTRCENVTVEPLRGVRVSIGDYSVVPGGTVNASITLHNIVDYGTGTICVEYDPAVVHVIKVDSSPHSSVLTKNMNNAKGVTCISALNVTGVSGDVIFAYLTLKAIGSEGRSSSLILNITNLANISYTKIPTVVENGSFSIKEGNAPIVGNPTAAPSIILNDNGRARVPGTNITRLNVSVSDDSGVRSVTINLTPILGPGHDDVPMTLIEGDSKSGIWSVVTNASYDPGVNKTHCLQVNATDIFGNSNTDNCILLTVLRRGDVVRDNRVDIADAFRIARYTVGLEPAPDELVADVVPADEHDGVDMMDALYIARYSVGLEPAP